MAVHKILLFYRFTPLLDPDAIRLWQRELCESLGLRGRILISKDGINGTVGGELTAVKRYLRRIRDYAPLKDLDVQWSDGTGDDFPKLSVRVREEIVSFGAPEELRVDAHGVVGGGRKLSPGSGRRAPRSGSSTAVTPSKRRSAGSRMPLSRRSRRRASSRPSSTAGSTTISRTSRSSPTARAASAARCSAPS